MSVWANRGARSVGCPAKIYFTFRINFDIDCNGGLFVRRNDEDHLIIQEGVGRSSSMSAEMADKPSPHSPIVTDGHRLQ